MAAPPVPVSQRADVVDELGGLVDLEVDPEHPEVDRERLANPLPDRAIMLMAFAYRGQDAMVEDLLGRGAPAAARDADGYTALMYAAQNGHDGCVRVLLAHGAGANVGNKDDSTRGLREMEAYRR